VSIDMMCAVRGMSGAWRLGTGRMEMRQRVWVV
jgi:hypothetical protein